MSRGKEKSGATGAPLSSPPRAAPLAAINKLVSPSLPDTNSCAPLVCARVITVAVPNDVGDDARKKSGARVCGFDRGKRKISGVAVFAILHQHDVRAHLSAGASLPMLNFPTIALPDKLIGL